MTGVEFSGPAAPLAPADIAAVAAALGCEPAAVQAVVIVEAGGKGFLPDGRPRILFEAHLFSRHTAGRFDGTHPALSCSRWNRALYKGGAAEYDRLHAAIVLDRSAALKSASWGLFQILGQNHRLCGFADVESFVAAMAEGEAEHLKAFAAFVRKAGLADELRDRRWADFARGYNGPGYAASHYDAKLVAAYHKAREGTGARP